MGAEDGPRVLEVGGAPTYFPRGVSKPLEPTLEEAARQAALGLVQTGSAISVALKPADSHARTHTHKDRGHAQRDSECVCPSDTARKFGVNLRAAMPPEVAGSNTPQTDRIE